MYSLVLRSFKKILWKLFISYYIWFMLSVFWFWQPSSNLDQNPKIKNLQTHGLEAFWVNTPVYLTATPRCRWEVPSSPHFLKDLYCILLLKFNTFWSLVIWENIKIDLFAFLFLISGGLFVLELNKHWYIYITSVDWDKPACPLV